MNYLLHYLQEGQRFFFIVERHFSLLVNSIPTLKLDDAVLWSNVALVLGYSEDQSRKAGCPSTPGYGFVTVLGEKCFAVVGLPSLRSRCMKLNDKSSYSQYGKESFKCSPATNRWRKKKGNFVLNLFLPRSNGEDLSLHLSSWYGVDRFLTHNLHSLRLT